MFNGLRKGISFLNIFCAKLQKNVPRGAVVDWQIFAALEMQKGIGLQYGDEFQSRLDND